MPTFKAQVGDSKGEGARLQPSKQKDFELQGTNPVLKGLHSMRQCSLGGVETSPSLRAAGATEGSVIPLITCRNSEAQESFFKKTAAAFLC